MTISIVLAGCGASTPTAAPTPAGATPAAVSSPGPLPVPSLAVPTATFLAALPGSLASQRPAAGGKCFIDTVDGRHWSQDATVTLPGEGRLQVEGWALNGRTMAVPDATYVVVSGDAGTFYLPTETMDRPDVGTAFSNDALSQAGFRAIASTEGVSAGNYQLSVVVDADGALLGCAAPVETAPPVTATFLPALPSPLASLAVLPGAKCAIDTVDGKRWSAGDTLGLSNGDRLFVDGWAMDGRTMTVPSATYLVLVGDGGTFYLPTQVRERPDVGQGFGDAALSNAGFRVSAQAGAVPVGEYGLGVLVESNGELLGCGVALPSASPVQAPAATAGQASASPAGASPSAGAS